jgi:hypothetical protein
MNHLEKANKINTREILKLVLDGDKESAKRVFNTICKLLKYDYDEDEYFEDRDEKRSRVRWENVLNSKKVKG